LHRGSVGDAAWKCGRFRYVRIVLITPVDSSQVAIDFRFHIFSSFRISRM